MNKKIILSVSVIILIALSLWGYKTWGTYAPKSYVNKNGTTLDTTTGVVSTTTPTYTLAQVATHTDTASCYSVIQGKVYDLTLWVNMHPGGKKAILSICGTDGTERFMNKHKGGPKYMNILARFQVGVLK